MIRFSRPEDTPDIARLAMAQYKRTPWSPEGRFPIAESFNVCERRGHIAACLGWRRDDVDAIRVMHVWAEDGFSGRRAAVELMLAMEALADAAGLDLVFDTMPSNVGLRAGVEEHGCEGRSLHPEAVEYRRKARVLLRADRP
jgi:N-acetylglutamate synthase-like GNAT family acetyltransferase